MMTDRFTAPAAALAAACLLALPGAALADSETIPVLKTELQGMEGMEANVVLLDVEPGWETPRHIHPGQLIVYVLEGEIELDVEGQELTTLSAGEAVYETPDVPMVGRNLSATERAKLLVFQVGETGEPIMVATD